MKKFLNNNDIRKFALALNLDIKLKTKSRNEDLKISTNMTYLAPVHKIYGIPRGGIPAAYALQATDPNHYVITDDPTQADIFIDDIIDSGETKKKYAFVYPGKDFYALIDKQLNPDEYWYVMPWENSDKGEEGVEANIIRVLQYIGEDPSREGLLETPARFNKALGEWFSGYKYKDADIKNILKVFEDGAEGCDQMVIRHKIPLYSHCEHHIAAIIGECTIAYIPKNKVLGLSKFDRLVDIFARRLQVQERLTNQIADAIWTNLEPVGVGVYINARHMCVESRGVKNLHSETATLALRGAFINTPETRAEFLAACKK